MGRADVAAGGACVGYAVGKAGSVAQPEVEPLRTDRRDDVHGFTDECDPIASGNLRR
jgi:hypothetical protein